MLYDTAKVDHRNSENLEKRETIASIIASSLQFLYASLLTLREFLKNIEI